jgi:hypothetical protein
MAMCARLIACAVVGAGSVASASAREAPLTRTHDAFCEVAQYYISNTAQRPRNVVHADYESFKKSKTSVAPLETHQFVSYADDARTQPVRISCKLKTVDHLVAQFGAAAAGPAQNTCRDLNHRIAQNVFASLTDAERASARYPLGKIVLEPDRNHLTGSKWVSDYQNLWAEPDGTLHLLAKTLYVEYTDWVWRWAPEKFRGVYYCHLPAPEYLRSLIVGTAKAPARNPE